MGENRLTEDEVLRLRRDTPGCERVIHLNNAGASLPPDIVVDTVVDYLREEALIGGYEAEGRYSAQLADAYGQVARLLHAETDEIALVENASVAWTTAFKGIGLEPGDEIVTSELEYATNLIGLIDARKAGVKVTVIENDEHGDFPLERLEAAIGPRTKLIAVTHIPSSAGSMLPIEAIGRIAARHGVLYLVDACQTVGQYPIDVRAIGCDMLSATGRKYLRAPRGTGFLYVKRTAQERVKPLVLDQHALQGLTPNGYALRQDAKRYEPYEKNRALTLGLGKAAAYALEIGLERIADRVAALAEQARAGLRQLPGVTVHDRGRELCGIVTFSVAGYDSLQLRDRLAERRINVSYGAPTATPLYMDKHKLNGVVRVSVHYYNLESEITALCNTVRDITGPSV